MDKILSYYQDAKKLIKGEMVIPRMVSVWLTHICNLNCSYCHYAGLRKGGALINSKKFMFLVRELKDLGVESIEFSGGGEPTIHPDCYKLAEEITKDLGLRVGMFTNGAIVDTSRIGFFDYIRIGLDAMDSDTYSKLKGSSKEAFTKVLDSIKKITSAKVNGFPRVGIKFMINSYNFRQIEEFIKFGKFLDVDYVTFRRVIGSNSDVNKEQVIHLDNFEQAVYLDDFVKNLQNSYPDFIMGDFSFKELNQHCFMSPIHAVVTARGDLLNCCYFNSEKHIIGNVFEDSFIDLWNSERHINIIKSITPDLCNKFTCRWRGYNNTMRNVLSDSSFISFI